MVLKLDPRFPFLWRSPTSVQIGVDPPRVVLPEVALPTELLLAELQRGISRSGLDMIGRSAGSTEAEIAGLLRLLHPVLESEPTPAPASHKVVVLGHGPTAAAMCRNLTESGIEVTQREALSPSAANCTLAVVVAHYVIEPAAYGFWLRRDIPHLPIVFGDESATVGPVIEPGFGPCLFCIAHHRTDADPSWPALASQLWGRTGPAESALVAAETAAIGTRMVLTRLNEERAASLGTSMRLNAKTGLVAQTVWAPHPRCGCIALPSTASDQDLREPTAVEAPEGTGSGSDSGRDVIPLRPTRAKAAAAHG